MCGIGHVKLLGMKSRRKREKAALCGCGLLENVADLSVQRCRRTRRDPSSSNERRRKVARRVVRLSFMIRRYNQSAGGVNGFKSPRREHGKPIGRGGRSLR